MSLRLESLVIALGERKLFALIAAGAESGNVPMSDAEMRLVRRRRRGA
jgi:hypothetical protein